MSKSSFALDLICLTPNIAPGDSIEIEIFIVGKGSLTHNKMIILYPESLIDENNPGFIESCIGVDKDPSGNIVGPITGKPFLEKMKKNGKETKYNLDASGAYYLMNEGNFLEHIELPSDPVNAIPRLVAEMRHDGLPPIYMKLNSSKKTPSGDYEINFNFTYTYDNKIYLNKETVKIHVRARARGDLNVDEVSLQFAEVTKYNAQGFFETSSYWVSAPLYDIYELWN